MKILHKLLYTLCFVGLLSCQDEIALIETNTLEEITVYDIEDTNENSITSSSKEIKSREAMAKGMPTLTQIAYIRYKGAYTVAQKADFRNRMNDIYGLISWSICSKNSNIEIWTLSFPILDSSGGMRTGGGSESEEELPSMPFSWELVSSCNATGK